MSILIVGIVLALGLLFLPRILGSSRGAMLAQYEILEKRFHFERKVFRSKWGKGIGERHSLSGIYREYPISLYDHYHESDSKKTVWTSLSFEMLFAGELEILIEPIMGDAAARFVRNEGLVECPSASERFVVYSSSESIGSRLLNDSIRERLDEFEGRGSFRLSKGFFEYRETGLLIDEKMRIRFQEALMILAEFGDRQAELSRKE